MSLIQSFRKNWQLLKISRVLGRDQSPAQWVADLESGKPDPTDLALERLFDLCENDDQCRCVLQAHGADRAMLRSLYWKLMGAGAGQWQGKHWVPASTIAFARPLGYALKNSEEKTDLELAVDALRIIEAGRFD